MLEEPFRQGTRGPGEDLRLLSSPWGFPLEEVPGPLRIFHGDQDTICPPRFTQWLAPRLPGAQVHWFAGLGHYLSDPEAWRTLFRYVGGMPDA